MNKDKILMCYILFVSSQNSYVEILTSKAMEQGGGAFGGDSVVRTKPQEWG